MWWLRTRDMQVQIMYVFKRFLVHLSWRLKCTIVMTHCSSFIHPSLTFHIFDFFSEIAERNSKNLTGSKISTLMSSIKFVFFRPIVKKKQDGRPVLWLAKTFLTSPLKPQNGIQQNLTGSKISTLMSLWNRRMEFNKTWQEYVVFFGLIGKTRWLPWPLIGWDLFDFFFETAEWNSMKLDMKQDLNVLYQVCGFLGWSEKQDGHPGLWLADIFSTPPLKPLNGIQQNLTASKISTSSTKFVFFRPIGKTRFVRLVSDLLRHCVWNHRTEFNKTCLEARMSCT